MKGSTEEEKVERAMKDSAVLEISKSLKKQKEILSRNGVDLAKQWEEMQKSVTDY